MKGKNMNMNEQGPLSGKDLNPINIETNSEKERQEAVDKLVHAFVKQDQVSKAEEAAELGASPEVIDELVYMSLEKNNKKAVWGPIDWGNSFELAKLGATPKTMDFLLKKAISHGDLSMTREMAEHLGRKLTAKEISDMAEAIHSTKSE